MVASYNSIPRIMISGLSGGSGKTFVSLGLSRAFTRQGKQVIPFKKGPDYIDAAWLSLATSSLCYCLDPFFLEAEALKKHFIQSVMKNKNISETLQQSIALIEGNRGLFDGKDAEGSCSSAMLAQLLSCPVVVTINCAKITRTVAALVLGLTQFDPKLNLAGVILNNIASSRHGNLVRQSIEMYTDTKVLGVLPRMRDNPIPERHMGLQLDKEELEIKVLDDIADLLLENVEVEQIFSIGSKSPLLEIAKCSILDGSLDKLHCEMPEKTSVLGKSKTKNNKQNIQHKVHKKDKVETSNKKPNIAYIYDDAFWFYYRENLESLESLGANLVPLSMLSKDSFFKQSKGIKLDGFYIGGGFPELYAKEISASEHLIELRDYVENNMPIYAECGGFIILSKCLRMNENGEKKCFEMANIFPVETEFFNRPQGLGYTTAHTCVENPYHPINSVWNGHEFHFSKSITSPEVHPYILSLNPGHGMQKLDGIGADGLVYKQCFASYTHLFAPAVPHWARNFVAAAKAFQNNQLHLATFYDKT